jgi:hypothetical protein
MCSFWENMPVYSGIAYEMHENSIGIIFLLLVPIALPGLKIMNMQ